jgi:hypothetical protein
MAPLQPLSYHIKQAQHVVLAVQYLIGQMKGFHIRVILNGLFNVPNVKQEISPCTDFQHAEWT